MKRTLKQVLWLTLICIYGQAGYGQINTLIGTIDSKRLQLPIEKLYVQLDKPGYVQGDTIRLKATLLNADFLTPSKRSGLLYVELENSENNNVLRVLLPMASGLTWGNIVLDEKEIPEGSYTLRAYTNWMRNFDEDYIFKQNIYVASAGANSSRLVTAAFKQDKNNIQGNILLTDQTSQPVRFQDLQLKVMNGKHTLFRNNVTTGADGRMDINFNLPDNVNTKNLSIIAKDIGKGSAAAGSSTEQTAQTGGLTIPVTLNRAENIDLQFMPEGGALVSGVTSRIGFKAIGEDGKGAAVSGIIYNSKQQQTATFQSIHKGMGSFEFLPESGETYTAKLDGAAKRYPLPLVNLLGTSMRVSQSNDSLQVKISTKGTGSADYYLIGQARGVVCYAAHVTLKSNGAIYTVSEDAFPTGIAHFTLLNTAGQSLNERLIYVDHHDNLQLSVTSDKKTYAPHDSIALKVEVKDKAGKPVQGSFAMAVTDDSQVKTDSLSGNIINYMLLSSDLKGTIEEPDYYVNDTDSPQKAVALDNLLLTQGWVGYDWKQLAQLQQPQQTKQTTPLYPAEQEFVVQGKVTNVFNKPVEGSGVVLLSRNPTIVKEATTDKDGKFTFTELAPVDTAAFVIQAKNKRGKSFNVGIEMLNEFKPPVFAPAERMAPWYVNSDTLLLRNRDSKLSQRMAEEKIQGVGKMLKEVKINDKKIVKDSHNLNGPGEADFILDEKDMGKAKKMTLYELLQKKFPGMYKGGSAIYPVYMFNMHHIELVIDGLFIDQMGLPVDIYMNYLTAEDIKGIEIMYNVSHAAKYDPSFAGKEELVMRGVRKPITLPTFLEITTYSGNGAYMTKVPGTYIYKPLAFSLPKQFYRPRYIVNSKVNGTDQRSTIHWEPNIVTDKDGKATLSFYSADKPAGYSIIMQGSDLNGQLGFTRQKLLIH